MSINDQVIDGDVYATAFHGSGLYLNNIARSGLSAGTPNSVVVNDPAGNMSDVSLLPTYLGGIGIDSSALTGIAKVTAGVWSVGGSIVDADISPTAAIQRTKLASGTANHVIINNGSGVMSSEALLAVSRGGTGADLSGVVGPSVMTINSGVVSASIGYSMSATPSTLAQRDGAGSLFMVDSVISGSSRANTILPYSGNIVNIGNGAGPSHTQSTVFKNDSITQFVETGATVTSYVRDGQTVGVVTLTLFTFVTTLNSAHDFEVTITGVDTAGDTATYIWRVLGQNKGGVVTVTYVDQKRHREAPLVGTSTDIIASGVNILVQASGILGHTIKWISNVIVTTRTA